MSENETDKEYNELIGDNSKDKTPRAGTQSGIAAKELKVFIERIERLNEEKKGIADDIKDVFGEAKGRGYDPKVMRIVLRERKQDKNELAELTSILDLYRHALGMDL